MTVSVPPYIPAGEISTEEVRHKWSDWDPYELIGWPDEGVKSGLARTTNRAILAFGIGCAEWITYRLEPRLPSSQPFDFIEAAWVFVMGGTNSLPRSFKRSEWRGPIGGPVDLACVTVRNLWGAADEEPPVQNAGFIAQIALHVLPHPEAFLRWQEAVINRCVEHYPRSRPDFDGPPVPRELLDPAVDLRVQSAGVLIRAFVARVDFRANPYLRKGG